MRSCKINESIFRSFFFNPSPPPHLYVDVWTMSGQTTSKSQGRVLEIWTITGFFVKDKHLSWITESCLYHRINAKGPTTIQSWLLSIDLVSLEKGIFSRSSPPLSPSNLRHLSNIVWRTQLLSSKQTYTCFPHHHHHPPPPPLPPPPPNPFRYL